MINIFTRINMTFITIAVLLIGTAILNTGCSENKPKREQHVLTEERRAELSPQDMIQILQEGNQSFVDGEWIDWDYRHEQVETAAGQYPGGIVLSCIDSRAPAEIIFNLGIGDIFNAKIAGNILDDDIAGSMEYACKVAGSKIIIVMGHTNCGAVKGAIDQVELGNLTQLLAKIKPAIDAVQDVEGERTTKNSAFVNAVAKKNVLLTMENIRETSPVLKKMEDNNEIDIVGAMYDIESGKVEFFDKNGLSL
ncbi:MAG: carbonic anhydrase family protein [Thermodesulfobacteriales bacterium]